MEELSREDKGLLNYELGETTFLKMDCYFANETGDEPLNNCGVDELLDNGSVSYCIGDNEWINILFEVVSINEDNILQSVINITEIETI